MDFNFLVDFIGWGLVGGFLSHAYWLLTTGRAKNGEAINSSKKELRFRIILLFLSGSVGAVGGVIVAVWFFGDIQAAAIAKEKVYVLAAIAGVAGDPFLRTIHKLSN